MAWSVTACAACACNEAQLQPVPDAALDACVAHTVTFCGDAGPSDAAACVGDPADASDLPQDASYAVGCTANLLGATRDPNTGLCALDALCTCQGSDASAPRWVCSP